MLTGFAVLAGFLKIRLSEPNNDTVCTIAKIEVAKVSLPKLAGPI
jgi:hypothetical protein